MAATPVPKQLLWRFDGDKLNQLQGTSIANAGDVDGDGTADVITGLFTAATAALGNKVAARVYSGRTGALLQSVSAPLPQSHASANLVAGLPDLNGDGRAEYIVGTPGAQVGANAMSGIVRIFSGGGPLLGMLTAPLAAQQQVQFGASVAFAGDANGDGTPDLIVGAPGDDAAYVFSGNQGTGFPLLATLGDNDRNRTRFGASVGRVGRITPGATAEAVIVGAPYSSIASNRAGSAFVFSALAPASPVFVVHGSGVGQLLGVDVDGGRDLNGDGTPDFVAGAIATDVIGPKGIGYARTYSGANAAVLRTFSSEQVGDFFGMAVALHATCDGQAPTLVVGAPQSVNSANKASGRVIVFNAGNGSKVTEIYGEQFADLMGFSADSFTDLNGDGSGEFLTGSQGVKALPNIHGAGAALAYSCRAIPRPDLLVAPGGFDFGAVSVGANKSLSLTLTNQGDATLVVSGLTLQPGSPAFSLSAPALPLNLAPGASQSVSLQFSPTMAAIAGGTLRVQSNDPDTPNYDAPLGGTGVQAKIAVTPASADFGNVDVGATVWASITVKNVGNLALSVNSIALAPGAADYSLGGLPVLPKTLAPGQSFAFQAILTPAGQGPRSASVQVDSSDVANPTVSVPLNATGVAPNQRPTAVIKMDVPYSNGSDTIQFRGDSSFDPDGSIVSYQWDFGDGTPPSTAANPKHTFSCGGDKVCTYVVRLSVTDNGGKSDPTSISAVISARALRSRFYGTILQGGQNVPDGTVVEAYIERGGTRTKVAESQTQTHLGKSVYAIELPPEIGPLSPVEGGAEGEKVFIKYNLANASQSGTWYDATDQELNLTAPFYVPPTFDKDFWCLVAKVLKLEVCGGKDSISASGLHAEVLVVPRSPIIDPGPLKVLLAFELNFRDAVSGQPIHKLPGSYTIRINYNDVQLAAAGIADEHTLGLYYLKDGAWQPAGIDALDTQKNQLVTTLDHASIFALRGQAVGNTIYLPLMQR